MLKSNRSVQWLGIALLLIRMLRRKASWPRAYLSVMSLAAIYLIVGLLFVPGYFGGDANFLYAPGRLADNLYQYHGLQLILTWPIYLLPTGGILIVIPLVLTGWVFWYSRSSKQQTT